MRSGYLNTYGGPSAEARTNRRSRPCPTDSGNTNRVAVYAALAVQVANGRTVE